MKQDLFLRNILRLSASYFEHKQQESKNYMQGLEILVSNCVDRVTKGSMFIAKHCFVGIVHLSAGSLSFRLRCLC